MKTPKPQPVVVSTVCSLCGEDWAEHGDEPTTLDCIRLLKARPIGTPYTYTWNGTGSATTISNLYVVGNDEPPEALPA